MKKLLTVAALASAAAAYAVDIEVGTVGVTKIDSSAENTIVVTSYGELDGTSSNMAITNILKTTGLTAGDKLYVLRAGNAYEGYTLNASKHWDRDNNYTVTASGDLSEGQTSSSTTVPTLTIGSGFWLKRQNTESPIVVYGVPPASSNVTITAAGTYLVGNPTQDEKPPVIEGMTTGDSLQVFTSGGKFPAIYKTNGTSWRCDGKAASLPAIKPGTGFWYIAKGTSAVIKW